jgi:hypothetical protein
MPNSSANLGGTQLAARYGALSADHVEYATKRMPPPWPRRARSPSAARRLLHLARNAGPPVEPFRDHGVPMAVATDCNPGSSPLGSLLLAMNMACTLFRMTPEEALAGVTRNAARALGLTDCGVIAPGLRADLAIWDVDHPAELAYRIGFNPLHAGSSEAHCDADPSDPAPRRWPSSKRSGVPTARRGSTRAARGRGRRGAGSQGGGGRGRSMASTPASASWPACASRRKTPSELQRNLILSHCCGVGEPLDPPPPG